MNVHLILKVLYEAIDVRPVPVNETFVAVPPDRVRPVVEMLISQFGVHHLSTITGLDTGSEIELLYHFWDRQGLTLCTSLPREEAHIPTVTDLIPGAAFYEREVSEMLDVAFIGQGAGGADEKGGGVQKLFLPDDWDGEAPLRKVSSSGKEG